MLQELPELVKADDLRPLRPNRRSQKKGLLAAFYLNSPVSFSLRGMVCLVGREGIEPSRVAPRDFKSLAFTGFATAPNSI
jgi:hypothetical protein